MSGHLNILAISGSLRANASNSIIVKAVAGWMPEGSDYHIYDGLGGIPAFDDSPHVPETVLQFRRTLAAADGVFICMPEYAFGVPGTLKNAVDWVVSSGELADKPVALVTAATGGDKAHAAFLLTLTALSCRVAEEGTLLISFVRSKLDADGKVKDPATEAGLKGVVRSLVQAAGQYREERAAL